MNHYASEAENRRLDKVAMDALKQLDPTHLYHTVRSHDISMCGVLPAVIVLQTMQLLGGLRDYREVGYATSADVTGNAQRVVGYAGFLFR
jgi:AmmeMemoRadiSam system protein B